MARYRLTTPHYLRVPGTVWEQRETDSVTGRQGRKIYEVPLHLDPGQPGDYNYPGEIIVASAKSAQYPKDIIFEGPPTLDMEPLDPEAEAEIAKIANRGEHPIEGLPSVGESFSASLLSRLEAQLASAQAVPTDPRVAKLEEQVRTLTELVAAANAKPKTGSVSL
jgi:hypothetical protein